MECTIKLGVLDQNKGFKAPERLSIRLTVLLLIASLRENVKNVKNCLVGLLVQVKERFKLALKLRRTVVPFSVCGNLRPQKYFILVGRLKRGLTCHRSLVVRFISLRS